jgi:hypothetical protein
MDRPVTPILADAVEELAGLQVERWRPSAALRPVLAAEAVLCSLAASRPTHSGGGKARRAGATA